jgi:hypothetical protein
MKKLSCFISEPFILAWIVLTATLLWLKSSGFRNETKELLGKTGRSKRVLVRYLSKKTSKEMPYLIPVFVFIPATVGFLLGGTLFEIALCSALGFWVLVMIPLLLPMPSALVSNNKAMTSRG